MVPKKVTSYINECQIKKTVFALGYWVQKTKLKFRVKIAFDILKLLNNQRQKRISKYTFLTLRVLSGLCVKERKGEYDTERGFL